MKTIEERIIDQVNADFEKSTKELREKITELIKETSEDISCSGGQWHTTWILAYAFNLMPLNQNDTHSLSSQFEEFCKEKRATLIEKRSNKTLSNLLVYLNKYALIEQEG